MNDSEDDYLPLSGLQHFVFCRRQWALIHIENQWAENLRTTEGRLMHERAHDASFQERRGEVLTVRSVRISSPSMRLSGMCDVLEFHRSESGILLPDLEGSWVPYPVEYKRGAPKTGNADLLQLCGQAMCLEEMLCCEIPEAALFYGETRRRERVMLTGALRTEVRATAEEMHRLYDRHYTPKVKPSKSCNACSLKERCIPMLMKAPSVSEYLNSAMEETPCGIF